MKKRIVSMLLATAVGIFLVACGGNNEAATDNAKAQETTQETVEEVVVEDAVEEVAEELSEEEIDEFAEGVSNFFNALYASYKEYIDEGFDAENNVFVSPVSEVPYYNPSFALCDANGDNYDDLVIWGESGVRDKQISEVYFYLEDGDAFFASTFDGYVDALSEGCILVSYIDHEVDSEVYYDVYTVYMLDPDGSIIMLDHINKDDNGTVTDEYFELGEEITEEDYNEKFSVYEAAIIPLEGSYVEMTEDNILEAFNML